MAMFRDGQKVYEGHVLAVGEMNYHDDSDFYAVVFDEEDGRVKRVSDGTTRYAAPPNARVDATEEVQARAEKALAEYFFNEVRSDAAYHATKVSVGKRVKAVRGRKVKVGTEATVFWMGWNDFRPRFANSYSAKREGVNEDRVGVRLDDGTTVFADKANFEVVDPGDEMPSEAQMRETAARMARGRNWRAVGSVAGMAFV
jgi:hypothetical protein